MLVLNDIHIGFNRKGGTTPASQETLREYLFSSFRTLLESRDDDHLLIAGDLFDDFEVPARDWIETFSILYDWLRRHKRLTLVAGNHDWSPRGEKVSSFEVLGEVLTATFPDRVTVVGIDEFHTEGDWGVLAHCSNQQVFEAKLKEIWARDKPLKHLFLHANYDNKFAAQSDHSLNVVPADAKALAHLGTICVFAHEHQARTVKFHGEPGFVLVMGNQWPTSIADCLGNETKCAHVINQDNQIELRATWSSTGAIAPFAEVPWEWLKTPDPRGKFIRVIGNATSSQASDVINTIANYRKSSDAFVISNAVAVEGIVEAEELPASFEVARRFDVMEYVKEHLTPDEIKVVEELMKDES